MTCLVSVYGFLLGVAVGTLTVWACVIGYYVLPPVWKVLFTKRG